MSKVESNAMDLRGFPVFTGSNLESWIDWLEHYFVFHLFTDDNKLNLSQALIEGDAYEWLHQCESFQSWNEMKRELWFRFESPPRMVLSQHICNAISEEIQRDLVPMLQESLATLKTQIARISDSVGTKQETMLKVEMPIMEEPPKPEILLPTSMTQLAKESSDDATKEGKCDEPEEVVATESCQKEDLNSFDMGEMSIVPHNVANINRNQTAHQVFDEMSKNPKTLQQKLILVPSEKTEGVGDDTNNIGSNQDLETHGSATLHLDIEDEHEQKQVMTSISSWNRVWEPGGVLIEQLQEVEAQLKEEVKKVAELTSKLQEHEHKLSDRDVLDEQAIQLHKELQASHTIISEQREAVSQKYSELDATLKKSQDEHDAKKSMIVHLESMVKEVEQKKKKSSKSWKFKFKYKILTEDFITKIVGTHEGTLFELDMIKKYITLFVLKELHEDFSAWQLEPTNISQPMSELHSYIQHQRAGHFAWISRPTTYHGGLNIEATLSHPPGEEKPMLLDFLKLCDGAATTRSVDKYKEHIEEMTIDAIQFMLCSYRCYKRRELSWSVGTSMQLQEEANIIILVRDNFLKKQAKTKKMRNSFKSRKFKYKEIRRHGEDCHLCILLQGIDFVDGVCTNLEVQFYSQLEEIDKLGRKRIRVKIKFLEFKREDSSSKIQLVEVCIEIDDISDKLNLLTMKYKNEKERMAETWWLKHKREFERLAAYSYVVTKTWLELCSYEHKIHMLQLDYYGLEVQVLSCFKEMCCISKMDIRTLLCWKPLESVSWSVYGKKLLDAGHKMQQRLIYDEEKMGLRNMEAGITKTFRNLWGCGGIHHMKLEEEVEIYGAYKKMPRNVDDVKKGMDNFLRDVRSMPENESIQKQIKMFETESLIPKKKGKGLKDLMFKYTYEKQKIRKNTIKTGSTLGAEDCQPSYQALEKVDGLNENLRWEVRRKRMKVITGKVSMEVARDGVMQEVREHCRPELLNRLDNIRDCFVAVSEREEENSSTFHNKEELALSRARLLETKQKVSYTEACIDELTQEREQKKASESQIKEELSILQDLDVQTNDLQAKLSEQEGINSKLEEGLNEMELLESLSKDQAEKLRNAHEGDASIVHPHGSPTGYMLELRNQLVVFMCPKQRKENHLKDWMFKYKQEAFVLLQVEKLENCNAKILKA